ncbi:hypothetical protein BV898_04077 [Hypsibius exemplaris]|uniref:Uncharacterized protein n=1 Tax=Hypsibius exemplaris TaxID=2072580 RepID=A0A1W0X320_HYPEX|nr:hypothetical protein BV898_04077 [Hypsibius exemplaris]
MTTVVKQNLERAGNFLAMLKRSSATTTKDSDSKLKKAVEDPTPEPIKPEEVKHAVFTFQNGLSGGLDGLLPQHQKDLVEESNGNIPTRLTDRIAALFNIMPEELELLDAPLLTDGVSKLVEFDTIIRSSLAAITNTAITDAMWKQATLPVSKGGLGIIRKEDFSFSAFLNLVYFVHQLIATRSAEDPEDVGSTDRRISRPVRDHHRGRYGTSEASDGDVRVCRRLARRSSCFQPRQPLDDNFLRITVAFRLGATVCQPHNCQACGMEVRENGHHGLSCAHAISRGSRHSAKNEVVKRALVCAGVPAIHTRTPGTVQG